MSNSSKIKKDIDPHDNMKEYNQVLEQFKVTLKLSKIGEHFLNFIVQCRKLNKDPLTIISVFKEIRNDPDSNIQDKESLIPIICFIDWLDNPSEENFQNLQKSMGIKIDLIVKAELEENLKNEMPNL